MTFDPWQETDILAREQCFARPWQQGLPEKKLMSEVLLAAVEDFERVVRDCRSVDDPRLHEIATWFFGREEEWPFSFVNLCTQLNLDAGCIRAHLRALVSHQGVRPTPTPIRPSGRRHTNRSGTTPAEAA